MGKLLHGVDLIEIERIEAAISRWGERFLQRVFTPHELQMCRGRVASLAARWAAKEATAKLLGVGIRGLGAGNRSHTPLSWHEIEVSNDQLGRPMLTLHGAAFERAKFLGIEDLALSLSHTRSTALASVIAIVAKASTSAV